MKQRIYTSAGAVLYTLEWTLTEVTGKDVTDATLLLGFAADDETPPDDWHTPDILLNPTPSQIRAQILIGEGHLVLDPGFYVMWRNIADSPEIDVEPTTLQVEIV